MDNVNRPLPLRSILPAALGSARLLRRSALSALQGGSLLPARKELLLPWVSLSRRLTLALPAALVLFTLVGIVTALQHGPPLATPVVPLQRPSDLGRPVFPAFGLWGQR